MIANVNPSDRSIEESINTLKYANRAKNIKTKVSRNVLSVNYHISQYTKIIAELRNEIKELKSRLASIIEPNDDEAKEFHDLRQQLAHNFEERMQAQKSLIELDELGMENNLECNKKQIEISKWESEHPMGELGAAQVEHSTPRAIRATKKELHSLMQNMKKNSKHAEVLKERLASLEEKGKLLCENLQRMAVTKDRKEMLEAEYKMHVLELESLF